MPPPGYAPVFINHVGRHGSRHLTKDVNTSFIYQILLQADSAKALSTAGKSLKEKVLNLEKVEKKNVKSISYQGKLEQQGLADRLYAHYSEVFKEPKPVLNVAYTKEVRTLQTSDAFLGELKTKINEPSLTRQINDTILRFYDLSPAYLAFKEGGNWETSIQLLKKSMQYDALINKITQRFFTPAFASMMDESGKDKFVSDLFGFITIFYSLQQEIVENGYKSADVDMQPFLTCEELATLAKIDNAEEFLVKGPGVDVNGIQVKIALPLLADFIKTTDAFIQTKSVNAQFRFSHAETIAPYAALLGFTSASEAVKNATDLNPSWNTAKVIPLSSNIQWIFYRQKNTENYLVKFLLNEKEVAVTGLATQTFPYYKWEDVRTFYIQKMASFHTGLDTDYLQYLKNLQ
jgi:hypothetical protein